MATLLNGTIDKENDIFDWIIEECPLRETFYQIRIYSRNKKIRYSERISGNIMFQDLIKLIRKRVDILDFECVKNKHTTASYPTDMRFYYNGIDDSGLCISFDIKDLDFIRTMTKKHSQQKPFRIELSVEEE